MAMVIVAGRATLRITDRVFRRCHKTAVATGRLIGPDIKHCDGWPDRQATLFLLIGAPGSGKTTEAMRLLGENPDRRFRCSRDETRRTNGWSPDGTPAQESMCTIAHGGATLALLSAGVDVILDETGLNPNARRVSLHAARATGSRVEYVDLRRVSLEECLRRVARRPEFRRVPESAVEMIWERLRQCDLSGYY